MYFKKSPQTTFGSVYIPTHQSVFLPSQLKGGSNPGPTGTRKLFISDFGLETGKYENFKNTKVHIVEDFFHLPPLLLSQEPQ